MLTDDAARNVGVAGAKAEAMPEDTPEIAEKRERNAFMESLAPEAKDRFLAALESAAQRGLSDKAAWEEAVVAAETTY